MRAHDCEFVSVWDREEVETNATFDEATGEVLDIEAAEVDEDVGTLTREFIRFPGVDGEFDVEADAHGTYAVRSLDEVLAAIQASALGMHA